MNTPTNPGASRAESTPTIGIISDLGAGRWAWYPPESIGGVAQYFSSEQSAVEFQMLYSQLQNIPKVVIVDGPREQADTPTRVFNSFMLCSKSKRFLDSRGAYGSIANARLFSIHDGDDIQHGFRISMNDGADIVPCEDGPYRPDACNENARLHADREALKGLAVMCNAYLEPIADQLEICHKQPSEAKALRQLLEMARAALAAAKAA